MFRIGQAVRTGVIACLVVIGAAPGAARAGLDGCSLLKSSEVDEVIGPHTHFDEQTNPRDGTCEWIAKSPARKGSEFHERITVHATRGTSSRGRKVRCAASLSRPSRRTRSGTGCRAKCGSTVPGGAYAS